MLLKYYMYEFADEQLEGYELRHSFSIICQNSNSALMFLVGSVLLSTHFLASVLILTPIYIAGTVYIYHIRQDYYELSDDEVVPTGLKTSIYPILLVTLCSWIIADRELSAFFKQQLLVR